MRRKSWDNLREEIDRCRMIYPDMKDAEEMIRLVLQAEKDFYRDYPRAMEPVHFGWSEEEIKEKFKDDQTLGMDRLEIETNSFKELLSYLAGALSGSNRELEGALEEMKERINFRLPVVSEYTTLEEAGMMFEDIEKETSLEQDLATFLFHFSLSSLFQRRMELLLSEIDTTMWRRGDCPVCGQKPHYGMLRKEDGAKIMECWLCGTRYQHMRVKCPFCDSENKDEIGLFTAANLKVCRVHFCKECNGYYKIFDLREYRGGEANLFVHHLATLSHDLLAQKEGFSPGSGLEWVSDIELSGQDHKH